MSAYQQPSLIQKNQEVAARLFPPADKKLIEKWLDAGEFSLAEKTIDSVLANIEKASDQADTPRSAINPLASSIYWLKHIVCQNQGRSQDALAALRQALKHAPGQPLILYTAGMLAFEQQAYREAASWWNDALLWMGERVEDAEDYFMSMTLKCREALDNGIQESMLYIVLANYYIEYPLPPFENEKTPAKRYQAVLEWGQAAQKLEPDNPWCFYVLGRAHQRLNQHQQAIEYLQRYLKQCPNPAIQFALLRSQLMIKETPEITAIENGPIASRYYDMGTFIEDELLPLVKKNAPQHAQLLELEKAYYRKAIDLFADYFERGQGSGWNNEPHVYAMTLHNMACRLDDDAPAKARELRLKALNYSRFAELEEGLLGDAIDTENFEEAIERGADFEARYRELLENDETDEFGLLYRLRGYATALRKTGRLHEAMPLIRRAMGIIEMLDRKTLQKLQGDISDCVREILECMLANGEIEQADQYLESAIKKYPASASAMISNYGYDRHQLTNQAEPSINLLTRGIEADKKKDPDVSYALAINRANLLFVTDAAQALADYRHAYSLRQSAFAACRIGECLHKQGDQGRAKYWLQKADKLGKNTGSTEGNSPLLDELSAIDSVADEQDKEPIHAQTVSSTATEKKKEGCYIATAVYGNYDAPEVQVLRRFRDQTLKRTCLGRVLINIYYGISPHIAGRMSNTTRINRQVKAVLDRLVRRLA